MSPHEILLAGTLLVATHGGAALSVDMPHGGCRLTVFENGSGTITFGAMPRWIRAPAGAFQFAELAQLLESNSHPQARMPITPERGSVSLRANAELRAIEDAALVRQLLEKAWSARLPPASGREQEDNQWVGRACKFS